MNEFDGDKSRRAEFLHNTITCAVLSPPTPQKLKFLLTLQKDARVAKEVENVYVLDKIFLGMVIKRNDVHALLPSFQPHHIRLHPGDALYRKFTPFEFAILQHNVTAISRYCLSLRIDVLASILRTDAASVTKLVVELVKSDSLDEGTIDHELGLLRFNKSECDENRLWDRRVLNTLDHLNCVMDKTKTC